MLRKNRFYLSTIDPQASRLAREYGLGLEIAEYCTAWNMDERFAETDKAVAGELAGIRQRTLHGPFNELFPCAIDRKARALAKERFSQAAALAKRYGAEKLILHGGYNPYLYYEAWYQEQSVIFWREFMRDCPEDLTVCLENVLEPEPGMLAGIVREVGDQRLALCLDIGHIHAYARRPVEAWIRESAPWVSHFHLHNNFGGADTHNPLTEGTIPMEKALSLAGELCPAATFTLEIPQAAGSAAWLNDHIWEEES